MSTPLWPLSFTEQFGLGQGEDAPITSADIERYDRPPGVRERYKTDEAHERILAYMPEHRLVP